MKLEQIFDQVDFHGRANLLWDRGELVLTIDYYSQRVSLYLVESFYVELYFHPEQNEIVKIEKASNQSLNKFLNAIALRF